MKRSLSTTAFAAVLLTGAAALAGTAHTVRGEITSLDSSARTLVIKESQAPRLELRLALKTDAQIVAAGKPGAFGDLKSGENVRVTYADNGAAHEASRVEVMPAKATHS
jgi:hypothetical protein